MIVSQQRDVMLSAGAAAVGINMTFLMPYMLLARGWDRDFRSLTIFDLCTGMFIPFLAGGKAVERCESKGDDGQVFKFHSILWFGVVVRILGLRSVQPVAGAS